MECWILYERDDLEINRFFADRLHSEGDRLGMDTVIVTTDSMPDHVPDCVVARTRDWKLTSRLESQGSKVFNSSGISRICNDKYLTYMLADKLGIPFLPVSLPGEQLPEGPPWVVKSRYGHGGTEVFKAMTRGDVRSVCDGLGDSALVQSFAPIPGRDMRIYVLEGEVLASVMRSSETDFRANHKLGGKAELCDPPQECLGIVEKLYKELEPTLVGIDFVFGHDGKVFLNEIEDVVGTRMLYELTDLDPASLLMERIWKRCQESM